MLLHLDDGYAAELTAAGALCHLAVTIDQSMQKRRTAGVCW